MPSWRFHISVGFILAALMIYGLAITVHSIDLDYPNPVLVFFWLHAGFILLMGSLMPDFDYRKTKIRYSLGPVLGIYILGSYLYLNRHEPLDINPAFLATLLLLAIILPLLAGLVIPFKHHGKMHSISAALIFSIVWFSLGLVIYNLSLPSAGIIAMFGFVGYLSHLVLDMDLKFL
jgi:hypothetical protein